MRISLNLVNRLPKHIRKMLCPSHLALLPPLPKCERTAADTENKCRHLAPIRIATYHVHLPYSARIRFSKTRRSDPDKKSGVPSHHVYWRHRQTP